MKITDYTKAQTLVPGNVLLIDGDGGTHSMQADVFAKQILGLMTAKDFAAGLKMGELSPATSFSAEDTLLIGTSAGNMAMRAEDAYFAMLDAFVPVQQRRLIFRGKNLGPAMTPEQKAQIKAGTFKGLFTGDYWEIGGQIWRIADFDYWYGQGDQPCNVHHIIIMPDSKLYDGKMNDSNITTGAYVGSVMYKTGLATAKSTVIAAFGADCILNHREYLTNAVVDGHPSAGAWLDSTTELPNEVMMYGSNMMGAKGDGSFVSWTGITINKTQLALMMINPFFINPLRQTQWLRDVVSAATFANVSYYGNANFSLASIAVGVRPVTGITGGN